MDISIRKLTPGLAEDYVHFFDVTPHDDGTEKDELPCYCVTWRSDDTYTGDNDHWYPTREERRARALQYVKDGKIQGYLAYRGDEIVGWCNATAECQLGYGHIRSYWRVGEHEPGAKIKSVFCFVIAPDMRRKGVATQLVRRVCEDAAADGFDFVEAYANKNSAEGHFQGPLALYETCGFSRHAEGKGKNGRGKIVMRKALK
ncbi:MAG: GNAT family N-acetyltransferase [Oscillospiraceae bacterium]|jgi:GNAT superfamily N-acetyltransferase|nr:GNAT family N-acetyltransferase [Oscillospiraceae bacterium]